MINLKLKIKFMKYLLPSRFKKIGLLLCPLGFILWFISQMGIVRNFFDNFIKDENTSLIITIIITIISFFSFLFGLYALAFSKEKIEDEMIQKLRLESFHLAGLFQIVGIIISFILFAIFNEPESDSDWLIFFIATLFLFWIAYILLFNIKLYTIKN